MRSIAPLLSIAWLLVMVVVPCAESRGDEAGNEFFEKKIRPILVEHCYECHSADAKKIGGNLLLDHRAGVLKGGDTGTALEPGKPEKSLLITAIRYEDDTVKMPPKGKLPAAAIADLEAWVLRGAPDPRLEPTTPASRGATWEEMLAARGKWWSLQPVQNIPVPQPAAADWSAQPVDQFVLMKLEEKGLAPAQPAEPRTLARRLSVVLTGLPPEAEQADSFVREYQAKVAAKESPQTVVEKYVDLLLGSPHFGERWARHWMDVVRFSETHGNEWNYEVHHAWRYRDYLIRAFNADVPYDQFIREHIAGDLLPQPRWNEQEGMNESVIGTGFYRFGEVNHDDCISLRQIGYDLLDNQIDTLTKAFQATTVACARCHDHKFDAVSTQDYYALLAVLRSSRLVSHTIDAPTVNAKPIEELRELKKGIRSELANLWESDATQIGRYLLAAKAQHAKHPRSAELAKDLDPARLEKWVAALAVEKAPLEDPLEPWRAISIATLDDPTKLSAEWRMLQDRYAAEDRRRTEFNAREFTSFGDFARGETAGWQAGGQGLASGIAASGEFSLHHEGPAIVKAIFPAGYFTSVLSEKLNGTLRSPPLPLGKKNISFQVLGQRSSAVRLVSNNCQLNYKNYRALTSPELHWETFSPPDDRDSLRTYAELMTMLDNPKFPDQLAALGGDKDNYRLPWEKAAENPRSYFGVTRVVLHDCAETPLADLTHFRPLFAGEEPTALADVADRFGKVILASVQAWEDNKATDDDVRWLDTLLRRELLSHQSTQSSALDALTSDYRKQEAAIAVPRVIAGIADGGPGLDQPVFVRGDCFRPGEPVPRRYLEVLAHSRAPLTAAGSGRLEVAESIASPDNPLTARVMVNRVWHHLFGTGLVRTVDDFGHVGDLPTHPELLDYLATQFVENGWSVKRLIRELVLTRTFQLSNQPSLAGRELDPQNRLLAHYPARRMEAEAIRDAILSASGRLDPSLYGMSVQPFREKEYVDRRLFPGPLDGNGRRGIYIKNNLMESPKFLGVFNFPGGKVAQGRRDLTNVPAQALALLNDPFVLQQADLWAQRVVARPDESVAARVEGMFQTALGRLPTDSERANFAAAVTRLCELHGVTSGDMFRSQLVWKDIAHAIFNLQEFIFIP